MSFWVQLCSSLSMLWHCLSSSDTKKTIAFTFVLPIRKKLQLAVTQGLTWLIVIETGQLTEGWGEEVRVRSQKSGLSVQKWVTEMDSVKWKKVSWFILSLCDLPCCLRWLRICPQCRRPGRECLDSSFLFTPPHMIPLQEREKIFSPNFIQKGSLNKQQTKILYMVTNIYLWDSYINNTNYTVIAKNWN